MAKQEFGFPVNVSSAMIIISTDDINYIDNYRVLPSEYYSLLEAIYSSDS